MHHAKDCLSGYLSLEYKENHDIPKPSLIQSIDPKRIENEIGYEQNSIESFAQLVSTD